MRGKAPRFIGIWLAAVLALSVCGIGARAAEAGSAAPELPPPTGRAMWYQTPPVVALPTVGEGAVLYRWDAGPGPWLPSPGLVSAPLGRHALQVAVLDGNSDTPEITTTLVRSDARMPTARVAASQWTGTAAGPVS